MPEPLSSEIKISSQMKLMTLNRQNPLTQTILIGYHFTKDQQFPNDPYNRYPFSSSPAGHVLCLTHWHHFLKRQETFFFFFLLHMTILIRA